MQRGIFWETKSWTKQIYVIHAIVMIAKVNSPILETSEYQNRLKERDDPIQKD